MRRAKTTRLQEKSGPEKWKLTEISVCYSDEYATGITDIKKKNTHYAGSTITSLNQSLHFRLM